MAAANPAPENEEDALTEELKKLLPMFGEPGYNSGLQRIAKQFEMPLRDVVRRALELREQVKK